MRGLIQNAVTLVFMKLYQPLFKNSAGRWSRRSHRPITSKESRYIFKVFKSCKTQEQRDVATRWRDNL